MKAPKGSSGGFEKHPPGPAAIVCTRIIDLGTVHNERKLKDEHKIMIGFESSELMDTGENKGKPFMVFANFNFTMYQNSFLCKFIEAWRGKPFGDQVDADAFDFHLLLGKPAFVNIVHSGDYVNIQSPMPLPKGMIPPHPVSELLIFDMQTQDHSVFEMLSEKMRERLKKAKEWGKLGSNGSLEPPAGHPASEPPFDDDIPFN